MAEHFHQLLLLLKTQKPCCRGVCVLHTQLNHSFLLNKIKSHERYNSNNNKSSVAEAREHFKPYPFCTMHTQYSHCSIQLKSNLCCELNYANCACDTYHTHNIMAVMATTAHFHLMSTSKSFHLSNFTDLSEIYHTLSSCVVFRMNMSVRHSPSLSLRIKLVVQLNCHKFPNIYYTHFIIKLEGEKEFGFVTHKFLMNNKLNSLLYVPELYKKHNETKKETHTWNRYNFFVDTVNVLVCFPISPLSIPFE